MSCVVLYVLYSKMLKKNKNYKKKKIFILHQSSLLELPWRVEGYSDIDVSVLLGLNLFPKIICCPSLKKKK